MEWPSEISIADLEALPKTLDSGENATVWAISVKHHLTPITKWIFTHKSRVVVHEDSVFALSTIDKLMDGSFHRINGRFFTNYWEALACLKCMKEEEIALQT